MGSEQTGSVRVLKNACACDAVPVLVYYQPLQVDYTHMFEVHKHPNEDGREVAVPLLADLSAYLSP